MTKLGADGLERFGIQVRKVTKNRASFKNEKSYTKWTCGRMCHCILYINGTFYHASEAHYLGLVGFCRALGEFGRVPEWLGLGPMCDLKIDLLTKIRASFKNEKSYANRVCGRMCHCIL